MLSGLFDHSQVMSHILVVAIIPNRTLDPPQQTLRSSSDPSALAHLGNFAHTRIGTYRENRDYIICHRSYDSDLLLDCHGWGLRYRFHAETEGDPDSDGVRIMKRDETHTHGRKECDLSRVVELVYSSSSSSLRVEMGRTRELRGV